MQKLIKLFLLISIITLTLSKPYKPSSFLRLESSKESVFKYKSAYKDHNKSTDIDHDFDVVIKGGQQPNEILIQLVKPLISLHGPHFFTAASPIELPFIVELDKDGAWSRLILSPNDTEFSRNWKAGIVTSLIFNQTQIEEEVKLARPTYKYEDNYDYGLCQVTKNFSET